MRLLIALTATTIAVAAASAGAHDGPSVSSAAGVVPAGERYVLQGESWFVGPRCEPRVELSQREAHGFRVGSARVRDNGTFTFSRRVPRSTPLGTRIVLDVTQFCDGVGTSRTVKLKVGRASHGCLSPLSVDEAAYDLRVFGGLGCSRGAHAIGAFIDTRIEPDGWSCAHVDRRIAGHDFACIESARPGRRVIARRVREV